MTRKFVPPTYWMPGSFLLIGMFSICLLVWVDRINDSQHANFALIDSLEDIKTSTTTFHLWLEESIGGEDSAHGAFWKDIDKAERLAAAILSGGSSPGGVVMEPLGNRDLRKRIVELQALLGRFRAIAIDRARDPGHSGIGSEMDRRFDALFKQILLLSVEMETLVEGEKLASQARSRNLIIGILVTWSFIVLGATAGLFSLERRRKAAEQALVSAHTTLLFQAEELKNHREHLSEMVEMRTGELSAANDLLQREVRERTQTEAALVESQKRLRLLSSKLLSAQEEERRKISRELHDELGQSLTLVKLRLRSIEKQLGSDQASLREECGEILQYLNAVIENVRRLSRDLSPIILEDLGLTRALRWLAENLAGNHDMRLALDLTDIDHFFPGDVQINIYRIVQEAFTNIVKHSGARNASLTVRCEDDGAIIFSVEDDGKGFDIESLAGRSAVEKGLGLPSMRERIGMLGGTLTIRSNPGRGTRITFGFPAPEEKECHEFLSHHTGG